MSNLFYKFTGKTQDSIYYFIVDYLAKDCELKLQVTDEELEDFYKEYLSLRRDINVTNEEINDKVKKFVEDFKDYIGMVSINDIDNSLISYLILTQYQDKISIEI